MNLAGKIRIVLLSAAVLGAAWQLQHHRQLARRLSAVETELQSDTRKFDGRNATLAELEQRNTELDKAERRAGNNALIALMRTRAAITTSETSSQAGSLGNTVARVLDNPDQQQVDSEFIRHKMRADMGLFFKLINLPPDKIEQYIDLNIQKEQGKARRMSALLQGTMTVADALREREAQRVDLEGRQRAVLGTNGAAFLDSIADGMRKDAAKGHVNSIQHYMGDAAAMTPEQCDRLQTLIKTEIVMIPLDDSDTDLFRSPDEWVQIAAERHDKVLTEAAAFLAPAQLDILKALAAADLAQRKEQMLQKRKTLGIK